MKVMFVIPKQMPEPFYRSVWPHTGIAYMAAVLKQHNIKIKIVDMQIGHSFDYLFKVLNEFKPDIVGVTCYTYWYEKAYKTIDQIKSRGNYIVVIGGPHVSAVRKEVLTETKADFAVKGEGEYTFLELCGAIEIGAKSFSGIKGLIWREGDSVAENEDRPFVEDLDALPFPAYEEFELTEYKCFEDKELPIITSRGCPYNCIFCGIRLSMGRRFRARSPENVVNELEYWYKKGWNNFAFNDDCFSFDLNRAKKICDLITERRLKIKYHLDSGIRVDRVDRELFEKMKESGCTFISFGVESGNQEILRKIRKGITLEQVVKAVDMAREAGIKTNAFFIIGHPYETFEKAMDTLRFAEKLQADYVSFSNLIPYPETDLFNWVKKNAKLLYSPEVYLNAFSCWQNSPIFETKDYTLKEREKALKMAFSLHWKRYWQFKLGRVAGYLTYLLTKSETLEKMGRKVFLGTKVGNKMIKSFILLKNNLSGMEEA